MRTLKLRYNIATGELTEETPQINLIRRDDYNIELHTQENGAAKLLPEGTKIKLAIKERPDGEILNTLSDWSHANALYQPYTAEMSLNTEAMDSAFGPINGEEPLSFSAYLEIELTDNNGNVNSSSPVEVRILNDFVRDGLIPPSPGPDPWEDADARYLRYDTPQELSPEQAEALRGALQIPPQTGGGSWGEIEGTIEDQTDLMMKLAELVPTTRQISTSGLIVGGGNLSANRTLSVPIATPSEALIGVSNIRALTPQRLKYVLDNRIGDWHDATLTINSVQGSEVFWHIIKYTQSIIPTNSVLCLHIKDIEMHVVRASETEILHKIDVGFSDAIVPLSVGMYHLQHGSADSQFTITYDDWEVGWKARFSCYGLPPNYGEYAAIASFRYRLFLAPKIATGGGGSSSGAYIPAP